MNNIQVSIGNFKSYDIPLIAHIGGNEPRLIRIGNAEGASKCILCIESESEIDLLIDKLLEIRKKHTDNK